MEYALCHLNNKLPDGVVRIIMEYEFPTRKWYTRLLLDNYVIYQKFKICRHIEKPSEPISGTGTFMKFAYRWTNIINYNKVCVVV